MAALFTVLVLALALLLGMSSHGATNYELMNFPLFSLSDALILRRLVT